MACVSTWACGSKREGGYSPNNPGLGGSGNGGSGNASGNGGSGNGSGNGGSGNASGNGGAGNFGGGGPGCDGTKTPSEDACVIHETYAVFVSPNGDDLNGDGSRAKPYKTLDFAVTSAATEQKRVYACATAGKFDLELTLDANVDGVSLYGGFDCQSWDWQSAKKTEVTGPASGVVKIQDLVTGTSIEDFAITSKAATSPGSASIGIVVGNSQNVKLSRLSVTAGAGASGIAGYSTPGVAAGGKQGVAGKAQCNASAAGGAETNSGCGFPESKGGGGGYAGVGTGIGGSGVDGLPTLGGGLGGEGEDDTIPGWSCSGVGNGKNGKPGANGTNGAGSTSPGTLVANGWTSKAGEIGSNGGNGQGGGGGGGRKAPSTCGTTPNPPTGASGGSGGSGGCGGLAGEGGKGGGASIALTAFQSQVTLVDSDFVAGSGGKGGGGGKGQLGGPGAGGGPGGTGACQGGAGAKGGDGGHGGGGAGGPSIGVAWKGTKPVRTGGSIKIATIAASGGADGLGAITGPGVGGPGLLTAEQELP